MQRVLVCALVAACAGAPKAQREYYAIAAGGTFVGAPSTATALDVRFADQKAIIYRIYRNDKGGPTAGVGIRRADGTYDIAFYHLPPRPQRVLVPSPPPLPGYPDVDIELIVVRADLSGAIVSPNETPKTFRAIVRGDELVLDGPGVGHTIVHLADDARATFTGDIKSVNAVYARFANDILIATTFSGRAQQLSVGRYDFARGRGENAGPHGRGVETFTPSR